MYEIIVVKNFSNDTIDEQLDGRNVKLIDSQNVSLGGKLSEAIGLAKGHVICVLEDDDEFELNRLERIKSVLEAINGSCMYSNARKLIDENGNIIEYHRYSRFIGSKDAEIEIISPENAKVRHDIPRHNLSSMAITKSTLEKYRMSFDSINFALDIYVACIALRENSTIVVDSYKLTKYRIHNNQAIHWANSFQTNTTDEIRTDASKHVSDLELCIQMCPESALSRMLTYLVYHVKVMNLIYFESADNRREALSTLFLWLKAMTKHELSNFLLMTPLILLRMASPKICRKLVAVFRV